MQRKRQPRVQEVIPQVQGSLRGVNGEDRCLGSQDPLDSRDIKELCQ